MAEVVVTVRKWGNSVGVTLPSETVERERIKPNDKLLLNVQKVVSIRELFGTFKTKKSVQQLKNELRKGWD